MQIDINADAGESFGNWQAADEAALFPFLSSVNLACGFHAGDGLNMQESVELAAKHNLAIGAHPSFNDLAGFGRRYMAVAEKELYADIIYQLGALNGFLQLKNLKMHHVKPHGALYAAVMKEEKTARAVVQAIFDFDSSLPLLTLAGKAGQGLRRIAGDIGLKVVAEAFPDRAYSPDASLLPRSMPGAVLNEPEEIAERAVLMAAGRPFKSSDGSEIIINAETLCIHGDNSNSAKTAKAVHEALLAEGIEIKAF